MKLLTLTAALFLAATGAAQAQNTFTIQSKGAPVGKCVYSFDKTKDGFKVSSRYQARVASQFQTTDSLSQSGQTVTDVQQTHSYKLDANYAYTGGSITDSTNQVTLGYSPNKQHTEMLLTMLQVGIQGPSKDLPLMPAYLVAPGFDASALQSLLYMATSHPAADSLYFLIVPQDVKKGPMSGQIRWQALADTTGTLDGKTITVHHFGFTYGKPTYDIYADETNKLMQADVSAVKASMVRNGFVLTAQ